MSDRPTSRSTEQTDMLARLREEFLRLLTEDSETKDRRRKDYNQAIFTKDGWMIWRRLDLDMVMEKYDRAVKEARRG